MKYGESLKQKAVWSHHNIDYDDIKLFIKDRTTPGKGKTVSIPGRGDEKLVEFENELFRILQDQHLRLDFFVKSKAGEIQRRLDQAKKQLKRLSLQNDGGIGRIPLRRLERYSRLENDVLKAGDEIKFLARFVTAQRTAFRKLLKKYKKWTGSPDLETRFREQVLDDPKSFSKLNLEPMLDEYSETLQNLRSLYESRLQEAASGRVSSRSSPHNHSHTVANLQEALKSGAKVDFDTAIKATPLGSRGTIAHYFVHPENIIELQVFLLQHLEYHSSRSRKGSAVSTPSEPMDANPSEDTDCFLLVADDAQRLANEHSTVTVDEREHQPGLVPQREKAAVRWTSEEDPVVTIRQGPSKTKSSPMKIKLLDTFFDKSEPLPTKKSVTFAKGSRSLNEVRDDVLQDETVRPLCELHSCRSRFKRLNGSAEGLVLAALDANISMQKLGKNGERDEKADFPFAVLQVRQEGSAVTDLISILDHNFLVERVFGFSLSYHAVYHCHGPPNTAPPLWLPMLSQDIRKLPPAALKPRDSVAEGSSSSATQKSTSTNSVIGFTDSTTAVENGEQSSSTITESLQAPPLRAFRQKRHRAYPESPTQPQQKYWSEYDHPEDDPDEDAYVIYMDPNEKSIFDKLFDKLGTLFSKRRPDDEETLLSSPGSLTDAEISSDEEEAHHRTLSYGTVTPRSLVRSRMNDRRHVKDPPFLPHITTICLFASIAILVVAYVLVTSYKHRYAYRVDASVLFAVCCSLAFAVIGFIPLFGRRNGTWSSFSVAVLILVIDAICSGWLLAWMLG